MCEADLGVSVVLGGSVLVGAPGVELAVTLKLHNRGEDAYGTTLRLRHPRGLSFRRAGATQVRLGASLIGDPPLAPAPRAGGTGGRQRGWGGGSAPNPKPGTPRTTEARST